MKVHLLAAAVVLFGMTYLASAEESQSMLLTSNKMIGASIYNAGDDAVASVKSVVLDHDGKPLFVVANVGGVAGVGATHVAVPWNALNCECTKQDGERECRISVSMTEERLAKAPQLKTAHYSELSDPEWVKINANFYSVESTRTTSNPDELICVATVTDADIQGQNDESVGQLDAIIFDMKAGKAVYGVIGDRGTIGLNEEYTAVPFQALNFHRDADQEEIQISINATPREVKAAPSVTPSDYPELDLASVRDRVNQTFRATK